MAKSFRVKLVRSPIGCPETQRKTLQALNLTRLNREVTLADNPANRGQVMKVQHLVEVKVEK